MQGPSQGVSGAQPRPPPRLVERPALREDIVRALCSRERLVAVTGIGGAGKSTLAGQACATRKVQRAFRNGIIWLQAGPGKHPVALLGDLANHLGLPSAAAGFGTEEQGRNHLVAALRGKRVLIAVDNVCEPRQLDVLFGLALRGTVLFTTRLSKLAKSVKAREVMVDKLTPDQALGLLSRWMDQTPEGLLYGARDLRAEVGSLALGVALAGAMAAWDRPFTQVLASIREHPTQEEDLDSAQRALFSVIRASIAELPEADQERYAQLAVFARRGPFPRDAVRALWQPELPDAGIDDLLAKLTGRNLLMAAGEGWYTAHDLQYDVLERRLGAAGLAAAHARLLEGYRLRYPGGWAESAGDPYLGRALAGHLHDAQLGNELRAVLTDTAWIQARLIHGQLPGLIPDYGYAGDPLTRQILRALRVSAPVLAADPTQVRRQLVDRLMGQPDPGITAWAAGLRDQAEGQAPHRASVTVARAANPLEQILADHADQVRSVAVTPDGTRAVSGSSDGSVRVWDLTAAREQAVLTGHTDWVRSVAVTADGTRAVSGSDDGSVRVWDLTAGHEQAVLTGHTRPVWSVAVTADGTRAVSGSDDGSVRVWDLVDDREEATFTGHTRPVWSVAITPDGTCAVSGSSDDSVRVWDLTAAREQAVLTGHTRPVWSVAITPDGTRAVSGSSDGSLRVWDLTAAREQAVLTGHAGQAFSVAITADGTRAVSGGSDGAVRIWDLTAAHEQAVLTGHAGQVFSVAITADKTLAVSGGEDRSLRVWDLTAGREQAVLTGHAGQAFSVAVTAEATRAASDGEPPTSDPAIPAEPEPAIPAEPEPAIPAEPEPAIPAEPEPAIPAEPEPAIPAEPEPAIPADHSGWVFTVAVTPDGTRAVSGSSDGSVRVWDLTAGREQAVLTGHTRPVWSVAVTADGARAVTGSSDGSVRVWDLVAGREEATFTGHTGPVWSVAVTPDGSRAVSGGSDGSVRVWDLTAGREQAVLTGGTRSVFSVAITPDGTRTVSGHGNDVQVWDLAAGRREATLTGHTGEVWSVAVTPDGTRAVSGSSDGSVRVWNLTAAREQAVLTGHAGQVFAVAVTADKTLAVSGGEDGSVRVWDVTTRAEVARWTGDYPIIGCTALPRRPLTIGVGQRQGPPLLLELLGTPGRRLRESPQAVQYGDERASRLARSS